MQNQGTNPANPPKENFPLFPIDRPPNHQLECFQHAVKMIQSSLDAKECVVPTYVEGERDKYFFHPTSFLSALLSEEE